MAELTREYIAKKRQAYQQQIDMLNGALLALNEIEHDLLDEMTLGELKEAIGAQEVGEPEPV